MNKNMITIKIFSKENDNQLCELNEYSFNLSNKIIDVKTHILKDLYENKYNSLDFENITERVYKDFGKLFFEKGLLPNTIDNYKLEQFTSENRTFSFLALPSNIEIKKNKVKDHNDGNFLKKIIKEERAKNSTEFILYDDDFPPLK